MLEAGFAVYAVYNGGKKSTVLDGYLGGFANLFSTGEPPLPFRVGPSQAVIDLETMKVVSLRGGVNVDEAISDCNAIN